MCSKATFCPVAASHQGKNRDCWPEYDGGSRKKKGRDAAVSEDSFLERVTAAAKERQLSHNSLIAYRRTWLKINAWAAAEGLVLETFPVERVGGRRHAAEVPRITSRSKLRLPSFIMFSVHQIPLPSVLRQSSPPRKPNCTTIPLRRSGNSCTNCVKIAAATLAT